MQAPQAKAVAELVVDFLISRGVDRVFGLQGGHIQPIWDQLGQRGVRIVDVRDEGAAVHMAHAHAATHGRRWHRDGDSRAGRHQLRDRDGQRAARARAGAADRRLRAGRPGRSGPAARHRPRRHHAAGHRASRTLRVRRQRAARPRQGLKRRRPATAIPPAPCTSRFRRDVLRKTVAPKVVLKEWLDARPPRRFAPDPAEVEKAARIIRDAKRPLVLTGRGALGAGSELVRFLDRTGAVYLDTQESRNLVAGRACVRGRRRACACDAGGRPRDRGRPQARLPDRLRLARRAAERAASCASATTGRSCAKTAAARSSSSRTPALALDALRERREGTRAKPRYGVDEGAARRARAPRGEVRGIAGGVAGRQGRAHASQPHLRGAAEGAEARCDHDCRRRRHPELRAHGSAAAHLPRLRHVRMPRRRRALRRRGRPRSIRTGRWWWSPATARSASMRWRSTRPSGTARRSCSSSPTTRRGTSSGSTRR